jgi:Concanavalin A-like lectin/glucanases superfamily/PEP-CTERM motif
MSSPSALGALALAGLLASHTSAATLLLRYNFDEASSGNVPALDSGTGIAAPGLFVGGATRTSNTPGSFSLGAVDLTTSGAGTYIDGGDPIKLSGLSSFTLTAWVNLQGTPTGNLRIMSKQGGGSFPGFSWNVADPVTGAGTRTASNFGLRLFIGGSLGFAFDPAPSGLSINADNVWAFIAVTYDATGGVGNVNYYVGDAIAQAALASTTTVGAGSVTDSPAKFGVGYTDAAPTSDTAPPGYLDDIRIYDGVLQPAEVEAVRQANIPEPASIALLAIGCLALLSSRSRKGTT